MSKEMDNEREKLLLYSLKDEVLEQKEKIDNVENAIPTNTSDLNNDSGFITNADLPSVPTKTSDLQNDSGFLTSHQDISTKENVSNKTTSISGSPNDTKYPTEKAVADYVATHSSSVDTDTTLSNASTDAKVPTSKAVVDYVDGTLANIAGLSNSPTTTTLDDSSTDNEVPTAKTVVDYVDENCIQPLTTSQRTTIYLTKLFMLLRDGYQAANLPQPEHKDGDMVTSVYAISDLLNKMDVNIFNTSTTEKILFGALFGKTIHTKIWFRQDHYFLTNPQIALTFYVSNLPTGTTTIPINILINGTSVLQDNLSVSNNTATTQIDMSNTFSTFQMFNEIEFIFTDNNQANAYLDYISITILNTQNCIILNRSTDFELYGIKRSNSVLREYARKYMAGGNNYWIGGEDQDFTTNLTTNPPQQLTINNSPILFYQTYLRQVYKSKQNGINFETARTYNIYISQRNIMYMDYNPTNNINPYNVPNVLYAQKSLHTGYEKYLEFTCYITTNFEPKLIRFLYNYMYDNTRYTPTLNNQTLPNEFIDFIPIKDYYPDVRTITYCGYLLLHKSGNIIFIDGIYANYAIVIGKGRQVNAYLQENGNEIHIYYNIDSNVIMKILQRETASSNWYLKSETTTFANAKEIYERTGNNKLKIFNNQITLLQ